MPNSQNPSTCGLAVHSPIVSTYLIRHPKRACILMATSSHGIRCRQLSSQVSFASFVLTPKRKVDHGYTRSGYKGRIPPSRATEQSDEPPARDPVDISEVGSCLLTSGNEVVAAASVLGENQKLEENPGSLSGAGCAMANAGREV